MCYGLSKEFHSDRACRLVGPAGDETGLCISWSSSISSEHLAPWQGPISKTGDDKSTWFWLMVRATDDLPADVRSLPAETAASAGFFGQRFSAMVRGSEIDCGPRRALQTCRGGQFFRGAHKRLFYLVVSILDQRVRRHDFLWSNPRH